MNYTIPLNYLNYYGTLIFAIYLAAICHELGHGLMAYYLGDNTAKDAGRLSLNPIRHIDLMKTIILPIILKLVGFIPLVMFKPVPVNQSNLKNPRKDGIKVAMAGPGVNFLFLILSIVIIKIIGISNNHQSLNLIINLIMKPELIKLVYVNTFQLFLFWFVIINLVLGTFNLFPIPPLDGSWIIRGILPVRWLYYYQKSYTYIMIAFIILVISGKFLYIFGPIMEFLFKITLFIITV